MCRLGLYIVSERVFWLLVSAILNAQYQPEMVSRHPLEDGGGGQWVY
jgi:hypothetical protein